MAYDHLNADNIIEIIKNMDKRERIKIPNTKLIELILALGNQETRTRNLEITLEQMQQTIKLVSDMATQNKAEIAGLQTKNKELEACNHDLQNQLNAVNEAESTDELKHEIAEVKKQLNEIEQYLRVNNLEVVGLPNPLPDTDETEETVLINALNSLRGST